MPTVARSFPRVTEVARLRAKNQLTLPDTIARAIDASPGDRFRVWVEEDGTIVLRKARPSAYGMFPGMWGDTQEESEAHINELRDEWER